MQKQYLFITMILAAFGSSVGFTQERSAPTGFEDATVQIEEWRKSLGLAPLPEIIHMSGIYLPSTTTKISEQPGRGAILGDFYLGMVTVLSDLEESRLPDHVLDAISNHYAFRLNDTPYKGFESFFVLAYGEIFGQVAIPKIEHEGIALLVILRFSSDQHKFYRQFEITAPTAEYIAAPLTGGLNYLILEVLPDGTYIIGQAGAAG